MQMPFDTHLIYYHQSKSKQCCSPQQTPLLPMLSLSRDHANGLPPLSSLVMTTTKEERVEAGEMLPPQLKALFAVR